MSVTSISQYRGREVTAVLRSLLARAERGELEGVALCALPTAGPEEIVFSDLYRRDPARAVRAANKLSWQITMMQDQLAAGGP